MRSLISEGSAYEVIKKAAESVDLGVEELADLMVDGGIAALPPSDGIVEKFSLEDLGGRLWTELQTRPRSRRQEWYAGLLPVQQKALVVTLRERGFSSHVIGGDLGIDPNDVVRVYNQYADQLGAQVVGLRLDTIAGQMQLVAERAQMLELEKGNGRAAWAIEKDRVSILQSLGIVDQAVHKSEVTHKLDDVSRQEIDALIELERKKERQKLDADVIDAEEFDAAPAQLGYEDPDA